MCDRWDIGGLSTNIHRQTGLPTIFVYDGHAGGVGITERGFERFEGWVEDTAKMLAGCPCAEGCPSCVQSPKCGNLNDYLDKDGALTLLRRLLRAASPRERPATRADPAQPRRRTVRPAPEEHLPLGALRQPRGAEGPDRDPLAEQDPFVRPVA